MNFPLYSPSAPSCAGVTRIGRVLAARPFPNVAEKLLHAFAIIAIQRARMKDFIVGEIAFDASTRGGAFPLKFGRKSRAGPARISVGLEIGNVTDRFVRREYSRAGKREFAAIRRRVFPQ